MSTTTSGHREIISHNPATGEPIGAVAVTTPADLDAAVARAATAFASEWSHNAKLRAAALLAWADRLEGAAEDLAQLLVRETGKVLPEARIEVGGAIDALRYNAGMARYVGGRAGELSDGSIGHVERVPLGVTALIVPWNWPLLLLLRDLAPALAAGVTAVVKPATYTPLITERVVRLASEVLPAGVVEAVYGGGSTVGNALAGHPTVRAVAFTGSTEVGRSVLQAASGTLKRTLLELGGKGPNVIFADADVDRAVTTAVTAAFVTSGQMCMACTRILAEAAIYDRVRAAVVERVRALRVGDPLAPTSTMGPLISAEHLAKVMGYVEHRARGGTIDVGGRRVQPERLAGAFMEPTVVSGVEPSSVLVQEEVFGPVVTVESFADDAAAVELANAGQYGLTAGVWTSDVGRAWRTARGIAAGTVWVNGYNRSHAEMPSGGMKESGVGRTRGIEGLEQFMEIKHINWTVS